MEVIEACASCSAKAVCGNGDSEQRTVNVTRRKGDDYKIGDRVTLRMRKQTGYRAVLLAYVLPFLVLMITLFGLNYAGVNEIATGLVSLGALFLYFGIIMLLRKKIEANIDFQITKPE